MKRFVFPLGLSIGIHGLILGIVPNPIQSSPSPEIEIIGLTPIVELPVEPPLLNPSKLAVVPPVQDHLSVPPLDLSARIPPPPDDFPIDLSFEKIVEPRPPKFNPTPPVALPPPAENLPPSTVPEKEEPPAPKPLPSVALDPEAYTQEFANIYSELVAKCGADNVVRLTIPHPEEELVSQISESVAGGVVWIAPVYLPKDILTGLEIIVPVTLVVDSDGTISRRRFVSSNLAIIDGIILQTIDLYEGKFEPLPGKCRLVTTKYKFSDN